MKIREMNISARAKSCLISAGYTDSEDIKNIKDEELLAIRNINQGCVNEIRAMIENIEREDASTIAFDEPTSSYTRLKRNMDGRTLDDVLRSLKELELSLNEK